MCGIFRTFTGVRRRLRVIENTCKCLKPRRTHMCVCVCVCVCVFGIQPTRPFLFVLFQPPLYDVCVVGGGIVGLATARELKSR